MIRIVDDFPTVENTDLLSIHANLSPQMISTEDRYLLAYASNTWRVEIPNCTFHVPSSTINAPFKLQAPNSELDLSFPFNSISSMNIIKTPMPLNNTFSLDIPAIVYFLAENILIHLPTTSVMTKSVGLNDGLILSIPYAQIIQHSIRDNLTKIHILVKPPYPDAHTIKLVMYPLQRFPPQPLVSGIYTTWANQTPLIALQYVNDVIGRGRDLAQLLQNASEAVDYDEDLMGDNVCLDTVLTSEGQADDEDFQFNAPSLSHGGMNVTLIGGSDVSGVKRFRSQSAEDLNSPNNYLNDMGIGARPKRKYVPRLKKQLE